MLNLRDERHQRPPPAKPRGHRTRGRVRSAFVVPPRVHLDGHASAWTQGIVVLGNGLRVGYHLEFRDFCGAWPRGTPLRAETRLAQWPSSINHRARAEIHEALNDLADHYGVGIKPRTPWPWRDPHPHHAGPCRCPGAARPSS